MGNEDIQNVKVEFRQKCEEGRVGLVDVYVGVNGIDRLKLLELFG